MQEVLMNVWKHQEHPQYWSLKDNVSLCKPLKISIPFLTTQILSKRIDEYLHKTFLTNLLCHNLQVSSFASQVDWIHGPPTSESQSTCLFKRHLPQSVTSRPWVLGTHPTCHHKCMVELSSWMFMQQHIFTAAKHFTHPLHQQPNKSKR
jgi:hypothetical protein